MNQSIASETRWPIGPPEGASRAANRRAARGGGRNALRRIAGLLDDALFLLLAVLMVPAAILVLGIPLALFVRFLLAIAERM